VTPAAACAQRARDMVLAGAAFVVGGDDGADERRRLLDASIDDLDGLDREELRQVIRWMALMPAVVAWETLGSREDAWLAVCAAVDIDRPPGEVG
jgi:hypothetical protein